jgi:hypothetical protein
VDAEAHFRRASYGLYPYNILTSLVQVTDPEYGRNKVASLTATLEARDRRDV